ncbi:MAG: hypothetical protein JWN56_15 [Sphingobacteriales bacterium]|nr:hypothetical protein [Sphingobacteriales bacterium]
MLTTIKGYYEKGQIILNEEAPVKSRTEVMITFLTETVESHQVPSRKLGLLQGKISVPSDFNEPLDDLEQYM